MTEDINDSLNVHDSHSSGLVGKFRSSLKKKISIKGMSGLAKTPVKKRTEDEDGEEEEPADDEREGLEKSENAEDLEINVTERSEGEVEVVQGLEETVETVTRTVEETVEVKKKKKKKRRPREEEIEEQEIQVSDVTIT